MPYKYVILGAGRQGVAIAYDLAKNCEAASVALADISRETAENAVARLTRLLPSTMCKFIALGCDVSNRQDAINAMKGADVVISAVPYRFNVELTDAAIAAGASFCDLGGNTGIVREQLRRDKAAVTAGVSIIPDCGLAPGLGNNLAAHGVESLDDPEHVHIRCGGLPEKPVGPLGYKILFNIEGLINEYSGHGEFIRDGKLAEVRTLTELEQIEFPPPVGICEAAVTSGGTSTCPDTYLGRLRSYDYKTIRYPGHFAIMRALMELGFLRDEAKLHDGTIIKPGAICRQLLEDRLDFPDVRDIVLLRVTVVGFHGGKPRTLRYDLYDRHDEKTGFTAMERTTGFPTSLVAYMQARGLTTAGARPLEVAVPARQFFDELPQHEIHVKLDVGD